jgi:peptidyl-prolyl cis-trans isomerase B (cyclophilin B)
MKKIIALILIVCSLFAITSCAEGYGTGACTYAESRDVTGRDIKFVEICIKDYGKMVVLLDATTAPKTVANFIKLTEEGFYDGLTFHRIMNNFMIQGGDPLGTGMGGSEDKIEGEFLFNGHPNDISHLRGVISMARSSSYDSASSQFFICNADSVFLDKQYAAFGYVVKGLSIVDDVTEDSLRYTDIVGGTGTIADKTKQPVIKYIKVLDDYKM